MWWASPNMGQASSTTSTQNNTDGFASNVPKKSWKKLWNSEFVTIRAYQNNNDWFTSSVSKSSYNLGIRFSWKYLVSSSQIPIWIFKNFLTSNDIL